MFQHTIASTAPRAAIGTNAASGASATIISSTPSAATIPATGCSRAGADIVAVRAMAPVAGMPPMQAPALIGDALRHHSQLERWRRPVMPSATMADSSDSIPPSRKIVKAGRKQRA